MRKITIHIPHDLTQDEARQRIVKGVSEARSGPLSGIADVQESWSGNHLDVRLAAMGQIITGRVDVEPSSVRVELDVPGMLGLLVESLRGRIEQQGRKMLE
jgi:hypothetical protein